MKAGRWRKAASACVYWAGAVLIAAAVIPAGLLYGAICLVLRVMDALIHRLEKD